jgi:hypothetical protein
VIRQPSAEGLQGCHRNRRGALLRDRRLVEPACSPRYEFHTQILPPKVLDAHLGEDRLYGMRTSATATTDRFERR